VPIESWSEDLCDYFFYCLPAYRPDYRPEFDPHILDGPRRPSAFEPSTPVQSGSGLQRQTGRGRGRGRAQQQPDRNQNRRTTATAPIVVMYNDGEDDPEVQIVDIETGPAVGAPAARAIQPPPAVAGPSNPTTRSSRAANAAAAALARLERNGFTAEVPRTRRSGSRRNEGGPDFIDNDNEVDEDDSLSSDAPRRRKRPRIDSSSSED
jgi:hypothetical protein